jgi:hypothetical protein
MLKVVFSLWQQGVGCKGVFAGGAAAQNEPLRPI